MHHDARTLQKGHLTSPADLGTGCVANPCPGSCPTMRLGERLRRIEREGRLDPAVSTMKKLARRLPSGKQRDFLHGVPLGHPLHPLMVYLPIGGWTAAVVLDLLPGNHSRSAHALVDVGLLGALPAVVSGLADWSQQHERQQRVGVVHAALNATGAVLFAASSIARYRAMEEAANNTAPVALSAACTTPTRCWRSCCCDQSARPLTTAGRAPSSPTSTSAWALREWFPGSRSSTTAAVQPPMGRYTMSGCRGWPSGTPCRKSRCFPEGRRRASFFIVETAGSRRPSRSIRRRRSPSLMVGQLPGHGFATHPVPRSAGLVRCPF